MLRLSLDVIVCLYAEVISAFYCSVLWKTASVIVPAVKANKIQPLHLSSDA